MIRFVSREARSAEWSGRRFINGKSAGLVLTLGALTACADAPAAGEETQQEETQQEDPLAQVSSGRANQVLQDLLDEYRRKPRVYDPNADTLATYTAKCEKATGIKVPAFSCLNGSTVPNQGTTPRGRSCDKPNILNGVCDPGSRFQVLPGGNADAVAVAHCRKDGNPESGSKYADIAVIQYNKKNGAVCFYQALEGEPGEGRPRLPEPVPLEGSKVPVPGDPKDPWRWMSPDDTRGAGCVGCHDSGGFIRTPYLAQKLNPSPLGTTFALPSVGQGFNNKTPLRYVGTPFEHDRSWNITIGNGSPCTTCHNLAVNSFSRGGSGTAGHLARIATNERQSSRIASVAPWMPPPGTAKFDPATLAVAARYEQCARNFFTSFDPNNPKSSPPTTLGECKFEPAGMAFAPVGN